MQLCEVEQIIDRVNKRLDSTVCRQSDGSYRPYVCIICDRLLKPSTLATIQEQQLERYQEALRCDSSASILSSHPVVSDYSYAGDHKFDWMKDMLLSPRASYLGKGRGRGTTCGYSACKSCKEAITKERLIPQHAIANKYYFGTPPIQLACLNDVELALLTPLNSYGYVFSYSGGKQRNLQGVVSYFRVKEREIVNATMQLEVLGLNEHVVVLYTGDFTKEQKKKAKERSTIRVDKVLNAVYWLVENNETWKDVDIDKIRAQLLRVGPIIIDESKNVEGSVDAISSNIETTVSFVAYFPDGTMRRVCGGQASIAAFKELVERSKFHMQELEFQCVLDKQPASDFEEDNFVRACLLQFPYGLGGMNEKRLNSDGSTSRSVNIIDYVQHLSYISQPHFHRPLFVLILYSIYQRQRMLKQSRLSVRGEVLYHDLANSLDADDIDEAVKFRRINQQQRKNGYTGPPITGGTFLSNNFLRCIDAVTRELPHSNKAAGRARTEGESLCHNLGFPSVFLTFAPDDEASFLLQILTGVTIDDDIPIGDLTDEQLAARAKNRREIRIQSPGLCALNFEIVLDIVLEEIVGVDIETKQVIKEGYFGLVEAVMVTVEEQGRKTLHAHILLWIKRIRDNLKAVQDTSSKKTVRNNAKAHISRYFDKISSTNLTGDCAPAVLRTMFKHDCTGPCADIPTSASDQQLRNLRHKVGCAATNYEFAHCATCLKTWTHEEIVELFLREGINIPNFGSYPDNCKRLHAICIQYQKPDSARLNPSVINAAHNTHFSFHTRKCFKTDERTKTPKKTSNSTKRKAADCRLRLPGRRRKKTCVNDVREIAWYAWHGECKTMSMIEINRRRGRFDELQNISCPVISESKMTCNSNVQILSPGPIMVYTTKYLSKANQKEETNDYGRVAKESRQMLSDERNDRKHDDDRREAKRRILRASFAHNKQNVVGPSMASWLTRKESRFLFSTNFAWCPLKDIDNLLNRRTLNLTLRSCDGVNFFENSALHYLCRPTALESIDVATFYTKYEVASTAKRKKNGTDDDVLPFENTSYFSHPSYKKKSKRMAQGVRARDDCYLLKLSQWYFTDSAKFKGSILSEETTITHAMEQYSRLVLILFLPFRCDNDLRLNGSHTKRLRLSVKKKTIRPEAFDYLQNIQDARSNALRLPAFGDELERVTVPYAIADDESIHSHCDDETNEHDESTADELPPDLVDDVICNMFLSDGYSNDDHNLPSALDFSAIKDKGSRKCGFDKIADVSDKSTLSSPSRNSFIRTRQQMSASMGDRENDSTNLNDDERSDNRTTRRQLVSVIVRFKQTRQRTFPTFSEHDDKVDVKQANGSAASIIDWARKAKLDKNQKRTFEILASTFALSFYDEAYESDISKTRDEKFTTEYKKLLSLAGRRKEKENLVAFVHGPAGAGKSTVVDLVKLYCKEYCDNMRFPFTSQTIVVTALTGVAATILMGETTHKAVYINEMNEIGDFSAEQIEAWEQTRLLIVDEISFASPVVFEQLDQNLRALRNNWLTNYGGVNVVFSGDLRQLKPVRNTSICDVYCPHFEDWVNCYIELDGKHRFKDDPEWGELLFRFRNGVPTTQDIRTINARVCKEEKDLPSSVRYATFTNKDRDAINTAVFSRYCASSKQTPDETVASALIILSDKLQVRNGKGCFKPVVRRRNFWENCGEDDVHLKKGRVDPALKLFHNCPVMLTTNDNVKAGKANGTRARVDHVLLKQGEKPFEVVVDECIVPAVFASQVEHVELRHENKDIDPQVFTVKPRQHSITAFLPRPGMNSSRKTDKDKISMKINQIPIICNTATTGHKLQGCGLDNLFVHSWYYDGNWPYVILSRVKTISGLYLRHHLDYNLKNYAMPALLQEKINRFRSTKVRRSPTDEQYRWMESDAVASFNEP